MEIPFKTVIITCLAWLLILHICRATEDGVLIKDSEYQKVTSNTLKWVSPSPPGTIPQDAVIGSVEYVLTNKDNKGIKINDRSQLREYKIYICRAFIAGIWVPGAVFEHTNRCIVTTMNRVQEAEHYDILINIDQAARLIWHDWERQTEIPRGAVFAGEYVIAHTASPELDILSKTLAVGMAYRIGKVDPSEGIFGKMSVVNEKKEAVYDVISGQVLVEIQPVLYEITITNLTHTREKILRHREIKHGETTLRNNENREMKAESVIPYRWTYESNWGQGRAMSKGLETQIQFYNSSSIETITWGLTYNKSNDCIEKVEKILPAGTASHVVVTSTELEKEVPYTGTLLSVFDDRNTMNRTIHGIWKYIELSNITATYGPLYFMNNNSLVPTTTTTTTETPSTITSETTTSTLSTTKSIFESGIKTDRSNNVAGDDEDSDALQLKKKQDEEKNNSLRISSFWILTISTIVILIYFNH